MAGLVAMIRGRVSPPASVTTSFSHKVVIVTGSNTGLGYESALKFVERGASMVILAVRSKLKGEAAKSRIEQKTNCSPSVIQVWELDMDRFASVDAFAKRVDRDLERLDIAVLNAGIVAPKYELSSEGWERMLQINTLSTALLAILLLPKLAASSRASSLSHLEIVASLGHKYAILLPSSESPKEAPTRRLHNQNRSESFAGSFQQYAHSKLYIMWIVRSLAQKCPHSADGTTKVIINDTCPGGCRTEVFRDFQSPLTTFVLPVAQLLLFRTTEQGSRTIVGAAGLGLESHGRWWTNDELAEPGSAITSEEGKAMQEEMWKEVLEILIGKVPRVGTVIAGLSP